MESYYRLKTYAYKSPIKAKPEQSGDAKPRILDTGQPGCRRGGPHFLTTGNPGFFKNAHLRQKLGVFL